MSSMKTKKCEFQIAMWINQNFLMEEHMECKGGFCINLLCLRTEQELQIDVSSEGTTIIRTMDMALAGDIVQSLAHFLGIHELQVKKNNYIAQNKHLLTYVFCFVCRRKQNFWKK